MNTTAGRANFQLPDDGFHYQITPEIKAMADKIRPKTRTFYFDSLAQLAAQAADVDLPALMQLPRAERQARVAEGYANVNALLASLELDGEVDGVSSRCARTYIDAAISARKEAKEVRAASGLSHEELSAFPVNQTDEE